MSFDMSAAQDRLIAAMAVYLVTVSGMAALGVVAYIWVCILEFRSSPNPKATTAGAQADSRTDAQAQRVIESQSRLRRLESRRAG